MEKSTWTLGGVIVVLCMLSVILTANPAQVNATKKASQDGKAKTEQTTTPVQNTAPVQDPATK